MAEKKKNVAAAEEKKFTFEEKKKALDSAVELGMIGKSGAWYSYNGEKISQGRENTKTYLKNNPEFYAMIESQVRDKMFGVIHTEIVEDVPEENADEIPVGIDDIPVDLEDLDVAG